LGGRGVFIFRFVSLLLRFLFHLVFFLLLFLLFTKDFPVEKFYRDSKLCTIGEGTSEIQKIVIAREVLKG